MLRAGRRGEVGPAGAGDREVGVGKKRLLHCVADEKQGQTVTFACVSFGIRV